MKFTIDDNARKSLLTIIESSILLCGKRTFNRVTMTTKDSEVLVSTGFEKDSLSIRLPAQISEHGHVTISTKSLEGVLKGKGGAIFYKDGDKLSISSGGLATEALLEECAELTTLELSSKTVITIPSKKLLKMITASSPAMSQEAYMAHLTSLLFEADEHYLKTVCTNGATLALFKSRAEISLGKQTSMTIHSGAVKALQKALKAICGKGFVGGSETSVITIGKEGVSILCGMVTLTSPGWEVQIGDESDETATLRFPTHYPRVFPAYSELVHVCGIKVKEFSDAVSGLKPVYSLLKHPCVRLEATDENMHISAEDPYGGKGSSVVRANEFKKLGKYDENTYSANLSPKFLLSIISGLDKKKGNMTMGFNQKFDGPVLITLSDESEDPEEGFVGLVMPMRV